MFNNESLAETEERENFIHKVEDIESSFDWNYLGIVALWAFLFVTSFAIFF